MIRREVIDTRGERAWLLISQIEHARLAGEVAAVWAKPPLVAREELLPALFHHDDGWRTWEARPEIDPANGTPREFLEMPVPVTLEIWRGSIEQSATLGPLAGWVVAGHFLALLSHWSATHAAEARDWTEEFLAQQTIWLEQWQRQEPARNTLELAGQALRQLQFFDLLSLWFCRAQRTEPHEMALPGGGELTLTPVVDGTKFILDPWPLKVPELELFVSGRIVPARSYVNSAELAAVPVKVQSMKWRLCRQG